MTVKELMDELQKWPSDMPVATLQDIDWATRDDSHWIKVSIWKKDILEDFAAFL